METQALLDRAVAAGRRVDEALEHGRFCHAAFLFLKDTLGLVCAHLQKGVAAERPRRLPPPKCPQCGKLFAHYAVGVRLVAKVADVAIVVCTRVIDGRVVDVDGLLTNGYVQSVHCAFCGCTL